MGALATVLDVLVGVLCVSVLSTSTLVAAMSGVAVGGVFTFLANRYVAFREKDPQLAAPALRFLVAITAAMLVHGQLVVLLRDRLGVPFVPAKLISDLAVFTFGQLLVLRFFVFAKERAPEEEEGQLGVAVVPVDAGFLEPEREPR